MNQLLNEAVRIYLRRCGTREQGLSESLNRLKAYRERDPEFRHAIASFAKAEATEADPLEGTIFLQEHEEGREKDRPEVKAQSPSGPVQSRVRDLLSA